MAEAVGPGDFVECIDDKGCTLITNGQIYMVVRIVEKVKARTGEVGPGYVLKEVPPDLAKNESGYLTRRFRPVYRRSNDLIVSLTKDIPARFKVTEKELEHVH